MRRAKTCAGITFQLLTAMTLGVACGGGRSGAGEVDDDLEPDGTGGVIQTGTGGNHSGGTSWSFGGTTTTAFGGSVFGRGGASPVGGYKATGGYATGGYATGGKATGGYATGGYKATGGYATGGYATGGAGGSRGGAGGAGGAAGAPRGGATNVAGAPWSGTAGVAANSGGNAGMAGSGGVITSPCNPSRAGSPATAGAAGAAGAASGDAWYVDVNGSDQGPGTISQPLKTLTCASLAAKSGDTIYLANGTWDQSIDAGLQSTQDSNCSIGNGIALSPNVNVRAINPGNARIYNHGFHGLCMRGGVVEGVRFECASNYPAVETREGNLAIIGSSWHNCGNYGLDVAGNAQVTVSPGLLTDYSEYPNHYLARAREQASLIVNGGKITFTAYAIQVADSATVAIHGVTFASPDPDSLSGYAVSASTGAPTIILDGGSTLERIAIGVDATHAITALTIDNVTITRGVNAVTLYQESDATVVPTVNINQLKVVDNTGLGVSVNGKNNLTIKNSSFVRGGAPTIMPNGSGSVTIENVTIDGGWGGLLFSGQSNSSGLSVKVRGLQVTGCQGSGALVFGSGIDLFDFGTAASPGNNLFRGNNLSASEAQSNFVFELTAGMIYAVGNTWDPNVQGADADGKYSTGTGTSLDVTSGMGANYLVGLTNSGKLRLAESP